MSVSSFLLPLRSAGRAAIRSALRRLACGETSGSLPSLAPRRLWSGARPRWGFPRWPLGRKAYWPAFSRL